MRIRITPFEVDAPVIEGEVERVGPDERIVLRTDDGSLLEGYKRQGDVVVIG